MHNAQVTVRELRNVETGLDLTVPTYKVIPGLLGGTTEFSVIAITNLPYFKSPKLKHDDVIQFVLTKKFVEFEDLYAKLSEAYPATVFPGLPHKGLLVTEDILKERRAAADAFLKFCARLPKVSSSPPVLHFLGVSPSKVVQTNSLTAENAKIEEAEDLFDELTSKVTTCKSPTRPQHIPTSKLDKGLGVPSLFGDAEDDNIFFDKPDTSEMLDDDSALFGNSVTYKQVPDVKKGDNNSKSNVDPLGGIVIEQKHSSGNFPYTTQSSTSKSSNVDTVSSHFPEYYQLSKDDTDLFIPSEARMESPLFDKREDTADDVLLDDDIENLLHIEDEKNILGGSTLASTIHTSMQQGKPVVPPKAEALSKPVKQPKPKVAAKPVMQTKVPKPRLPPKPAPRKQQQNAEREKKLSSDAKNGSVTSSALNEPENVDILKYIEENQDSQDVTLF